MEDHVSHVLCITKLLKQDEILINLKFVSKSRSLYYLIKQRV